MKAMIVGYMGEVLTEQLKKRLETFVQSAIKDFGITDFYFGNEEEYEDEIENEEKPYFKKMLENSHEVLTFILETIKLNKQNNDVNCAMVVARPNDKNFNEDLFDEIIQGYSIYFKDIDFDNSVEAYDFRDTFLVQNMDYIFWYSNSILAKTSSIIKCAENYSKRIVYV